MNLKNNMLSKNYCILKSKLNTFTQRRTILKCKIVLALVIMTKTRALLSILEHSCGFIHRLYSTPQ